MHSRGITNRSAVALLVVLVSGWAAKADDPVIIPPGPDCWEIDPNASWSFGTPEIPAIPEGFFDPGSEPFTGTVELEGAELTGPDAIIERIVPLELDPGQPIAQVPIQLVELHLQSVQPITVGTSQWDVSVSLAVPTPGLMIVEQDDEFGGQVWFDCGVQPLYLFTRTTFPFDERALDTSLAGIPPFPIVTQIELPYTTQDLDDSCAIDGFAPGVFYDHNTLSTCAPRVCFGTFDPAGVKMCGASASAPRCVTPFNDSCLTPEALTPGVSVPFNTLFASPDGHGTYIVGNNIWYEYDALQDGLLRIDTCGSSYNTRIAVYDAPPCIVEEDPIAANDNHPHCDLGSRVHVPVNAGEHLWIEVGGQHGDAGIGWIEATYEYDVCDGRTRDTGPLHFDSNDDGARDLYDYASLQRCYTGEGNTAPDFCRQTFDTDGDGDVDFADTQFAVASLFGPLPTPVYTGVLDPICPAPYTTTSDPYPGFAWEPCPDPGVVYRLSFYYIPAGYDAQTIVQFFDPEWVMDDLRQPWAPYPDNQAPLLGGNRYAWQVDAYDPANPQNILCSGNVEVVDSEEDVAQESFEELIDHLEEIRKALNGEIDDLEDNDLVKEVRLLQFLATILKGEQTIGAAGWQGLIDFLNCDSSALDTLDATKLETALKAVQALIDLIIDAYDLEGPKKAALEGLKAQIQKVLDDVDDVKSIKEFTDPNFDVWEYIQDKIKEGLSDAAKELAKKAVAKIAGKKAAGPIVSIVLDLWNFGDALFGISSIEELKTAYNIVLLEIIKKAEEEGLGLDDDVISVGGSVFTTQCSKDANACWQVWPVVRCWRPDGSGDPGKGEWVDCDAHFDNPNGPKTKTFKTENMTRVKNDKGEDTETCEYDLTISLPPNCPGPCVVGVQVKVTPPNGKVEEFISLWGVKPAPAGGGG
jgi:hypothetical protein